MKSYTPSMKLKPQDPPDLDVKPIMNLVIILIPLLLSMAEFTQIALLEYLPPAEAAESAGEGGGDTGEGGGGGEQKINLVVNLTRQVGGIQVSMYGKTQEGPYFYTIPLVGDNFNWQALTDSLWSIKKNQIGDPIGIDSIEAPSGGMQAVDKFKFVDARDVSITADGETIFQDVINTMDACRSITITNPDGSKEIKELFPNTMLKQFQ